MMKVEEINDYPGSVYIWLAFVSLQPRKEERFLYPIYPLICVSASVVIENIPELFREKYSTQESLLVTITKLHRPMILGLILCASHSLINGYAAPLEVYKLLDHHDDTALCINRTLSSSHLTFTSIIVIFHWTLEKEEQCQFLQKFWEYCVEFLVGIIGMSGSVLCVGSEWHR